MSSPHVVVIPYPAQGHVNPLMIFSQKLAKHGFKITFVNTDFNHKQIVSAMPENSSILDPQIRLVSIPDGLGPEDDRNEIGQLCAAILSTMPAKLEELIEDINGSNGDNMITCVIADGYAGWALEVANKMGIRGAVIWPGPAAILASQLSIPKLIEEGIIDIDGFPINEQVIQLSPSMPHMDTTKFMWSCIGDTTAQKAIFHYIEHYIQVLNLAEWWVCNSVYEFEPPAFSSFIPKLLPIGPLIACNQTMNPGGQFWPQDSTCLNWLDQQPPHSVIYVAFGSLTVFNETQFQELARGLELTNRPFLWVVRPGITSTSGLNEAYLNGIQGSTRGKTVFWAPQQKVLSHPAIACFVSHCGWNSIMEGLSNGVPFLCWPYFADQLFNKSYICDVLKVGLGFDPDENGIVPKCEVKKKVEQLLADNNIQAKSLELKEMAINNITQGGRSSKNLNDFIKWLKA